MLIDLEILFLENTVAGFDVQTMSFCDSYRSGASFRRPASRMRCALTPDLTATFGRCSLAGCPTVGLTRNFGRNYPGRNS
jgi:hypothetical protein